MASFMRHKEDSGAIEPFTARGYRAETRIVYRHLGSVRLAELSIPGASSWMRDMVDDGYAPESCLKALRLLKQALKWVAAQGLISKNPGDFRKPPKRVKAPKTTGSPARTIPSPSAWRRHPPPSAATPSARREWRSATPAHRERGRRGACPATQPGSARTSRPFRKVSGLSCALHDPRRALATMMMAGGCDVRTMASYLGHASASMAPDACADVGPEAKRAAVGKVADSLDADLDPLYDFPSPRYGVEHKCWRAHVLGGAAQGHARLRRRKEASHGRP